MQTAGVHNTTETLEVDVKIDAGADGVFADPDLQADYLVVKTPDAGGNVCVYDLSMRRSVRDRARSSTSPTTRTTTATWSGSSWTPAASGSPRASRRSPTRSRRAPGGSPATCRHSSATRPAGFDATTGTYDAALNAIDPALDISPLVCGGFWGGGACSNANPVEVLHGLGRRRRTTPRSCPVPQQRAVADPGRRLDRHVAHDRGRGRRRPAWPLVRDGGR